MTIEEQTTQTEQTPTTASRDDLIAAVRAAGGTSSVDVDAEAAAVGAEAPVVETPPPAEDKVAALMALREKRHAETRAQRESVQSIEESARARAQRIEQEAQQRADQRDQQAQADRLRRYKESPLDAIRADGIDPQQLADDLIAATDPTQREILKLRAELAKTQELAKVGTTAAQQLEQWKKDQESARAMREYEDYNRTFLATTASEASAPYLHARFTPAQIVAESRAFAEGLTKDGLTYGVDFDDATVVAYLEADSKKRIAKLIPSTGTPPANQVLAGASATTPGSAPKVQANGPRTLSAAQGSERRTSPKPLHEMTPEQKRAALVEASAEARRNNPEGY